MIIVTRFYHMWSLLIIKYIAYGVLLHMEIGFAFHSKYLDIRVIDIHKYFDICSQLILPARTG